MKTAVAQPEELRIAKRDGRIVEFESQKIVNALVKANRSIEASGAGADRRRLEEVASTVEGRVRDRYGLSIRIDEVQNIIEHTLLDFHLYELAKTYTEYRLKRDILRAQTTDINYAVERFLKKDKTLMNENANKDSNIFSTQRDLLAGAVSKASAFSMLPRVVANAHTKGDLHFHDADYSPFTAMNNCSLPNFEDMLAHGFSLGNAPMDSPKSIETAATQITQIIKDVAALQYGGQTVNRIDELLAPYARLNFEKNLSMAAMLFPDSMEESVAKEILSRLKLHENKNLHCEERDLIEDEPSEGLEGIEAVRELYAKLTTRKNIYDAMQTLEYQINSNRVSNGQTPFVTIGFGLGTDWFSREITRGILLNRILGLGKEHRTAIFPKLVYTVKAEVNLKEDDPNYDLKQLALECSTKRMYPDVLFYENIVKITGSFKAPMGCRSFLHGWVNPETNRPEEEGRMNLGVVTVNVPRIALEAKGNKDRFWRLFEQRMDIAHQALRFRIEKCKESIPVNAPTLYQFGAFGRLKAGDSVDKLFKNDRATVSLGYIGLYETTAVFFGRDWVRDHAWDEEAREFALSILKRMKELCTAWSQEEGYHYSTYSTPAESLTDRFSVLDKEKFGPVSGVTDHDFYTNSFHYPVWLSPTPFEKLAFEEPFPHLASGGFINYIEYPSLVNNPKALEAVWDYAHELGIGYLGANLPTDNCYACNFQGEFSPTAEGFKCPNCGNADPENCDVVRRVCGYLGNPVQRPMIHGRHEEIAHRQKHLPGETGRAPQKDGSERYWSSTSDV